MRPLKITMQAFGSYGKKTTIDLETPNQNLFLITGDTGAGKTTIFDAIVFALYGEASSGSNKKDGTELQSQFVGPETEPYVELTFSEGTAADRAGNIYTVRRVPRHVRPLKKGTGLKEDSETVSLVMPDGTEYPPRETDKKLEELVGLTKSQFMQVAMIAQGEFMELLRAKSDDKKVIFRKLFHTELYQNIVEELWRRRKEKLSEIAHIRTICQTEAGHISIPEDEEQAELLNSLQKRILQSEKLSVTDMEAFLGALKTLCEKLSDEEKQLRKTWQEAGRERDRHRDAFTEAQNLRKFFEQMEQAKKDLEECEDAEEAILQAGKLAAQITAAYEIQAVWQRYADAGQLIQNSEKQLAMQREALPELTKRYETAAALEKEASALQEQEQERYTKETERVKHALEILQKIEAAVADTAEQRKRSEQARQVYLLTREAFTAKSAQYTETQNAFLDAQAGFLAKEKLKPGQPCPVCGSLEHPHPCELGEEYQELTRETVDQLSREVSRLQKKQEETARVAGSAKELLAEKEKNLKLQVEHLRRQMMESFSDLSEDMPSESDLLFRNDMGEEELDAEKFRQQMDEMLMAARERRQMAEEQYRAAHTAAEKARTAKEQAELLVKRFESELPGQRRAEAQRRSEYEQVQSEAKVTEHEWKELVQNHQKAETVKLQAKADAHKAKKAAAEKLLSSAKHAIGRKKRPEMELLKSAKEESEQRLDTVRKAYEGVKETCKVNTGVYDALAPKMEERSRIMAEYKRIDELHQLLAGKVTGARMDIETYVQRYYLERILYAANKRFREMSLGQFELRMFDIEKAGEGKNRGLDLMVYSTVTGKVREVRTLSGGESFMAALSLARFAGDGRRHEADRHHLPYI